MHRAGRWRQIVQHRPYRQFYTSEFDYRLLYSYAIYMLKNNHLIALGTVVQDSLSESSQELSASVIAALLSLYHWEPTGTVELANILSVRQPTATKLIDGLVERDWVVRGEKLGRFLPLTLTAKGKRKSIELQKSRSDRVQQLLSALSPTEQEEFGKLSRKLLQAATTSREFAQRTCRFCDHRVCTGNACPVGCRATEIEQMHTS
jgi:DNA-binding MarR family transcriptional regulator